MTWHEIGVAVGRGDLEASPVRLDPVITERLADHFDEIGNSLEDVGRELRRLRSCGAPEFRGRAASAFTAKLEGISDDLDKVPRIANAAERIFRHHTQRLIALRDQADRALALAQSRQTELAAVERESSDARSRLAMIERQVRTLERQALADETLADQLDHAQYREAAARSLVVSIDRRWENQRHELLASVSEYEQIADAEKTLNQHTKSSIESIHFQGLHDRSNAEKIAGVVGDVITNPVILLGPIGIAIAAYQAFDLELADLLWQLDTVLTIAGLALAVAAILFPGVGWLGLIVFSVAVAKFANTTTLFAMGARNPSTGEPKRWYDVALDGLGVASAGIAAMPKGSLQTFATKHPSTRLLLRPVSKSEATNKVVRDVGELATRSLELAHEATSDPPFSSAIIHDPVSLTGPTRPLLCPAR